jgi:hypothetical protein
VSPERQDQADTETTVVLTSISASYPWLSDQRMAADGSAGENCSRVGDTGNLFDVL